jgi:hypothetical protein
MSVKAFNRSKTNIDHLPEHKRMTNVNYIRGRNYLTSIAQSVNLFWDGEQNNEG